MEPSSIGELFPSSSQRSGNPQEGWKVRQLGIPTISERVGQMVIKDYLEPRFEKIFSSNSYGYRPNKSAHQALETVRENCRRQNWDIDLDIKDFFNTIDHQKLMLAVRKHVPENWACLYLERWLEAPVLKTSGELQSKQGKGTPQGGVASPLLANLFLHYALDKWLEHTDVTVKYARYADDCILHCQSKTHAEHILEAVNKRLESCGLELHPDKTKIVYCKDGRRREDYPVVKFDFLGYSFQPRATKSRKTGKLFLGYDCAISISSRKRIADKLEALKFERVSFKSIIGIAYYLNPMIRGWVNYYGRFRRSELSKVFRLLRIRLIRWARKRYKRYRTRLKHAYQWLDRVRKQFPYLFYHWKLGFSC